MQAAQAKANHNTGITGIIAVICMIIDHVGVIFFPRAILFRVIGRIALPLFAWGIAIGASHTRNIARYAMRLFLLMIVSQPFYMYALNHPLEKLNIFAVLFLGLIGIWGLRDNKGYLTIIALMLAHLIPMDYGLQGVMVILLLYLTRDNPLALSVCFCVFCVIWGQSSMTVTTLFGTIPWRLQTSAMLALPIILYPTARRTPMPRILMYAMYPAHLGVLYVLDRFL